MLQNAPPLIFGRVFDVIVECKLVFVHLSIVGVFLCSLNRFLLTAKLCWKFSWCLVVSIYCEKIRVLILNKLCWVWIWWLLILVIIWIFTGRFFFWEQNINVICVSCQFYESSTNQIYGLVARFLILYISNRFFVIDCQRLENFRS